MSILSLTIATDHSVLALRSSSIIYWCIFYDKSKSFFHQCAHRFVLLKKKTRVFFIFLWYASVAFVRICEATIYYFSFTLLLACVHVSTIQRALTCPPHVSLSSSSSSPSSPTPASVTWQCIRTSSTSDWCTCLYLTHSRATSAIP